MLTRRTRRESRLGRLMASMRPIPRKLWLNKVVSALRIVIGGSTFAAVVLFGFYAITAWRHQELVSREANLRRVVAQYKQVDGSSAWTQVKIDAVVRKGHAAIGYPRKQITVQVSLGGRQHQAVSLEGVVGKEPELAGPQLVWGRPVGRGNRSLQILLSEELFSDLGGRLAKTGGPRPATASIIITRSVDDRTESSEFAVQIAGLLRGKGDRLFAPISLALDLDRWQTHKSDVPLGNDTDHRPVFDRVDAYVPLRLASSVSAEEQTFGVVATRGEIVEVVTARGTGDVWATVVRRQPGRAVEAAVIGRYLEGISYESWPAWRVQTGQGGTVISACVGFGPDDPRWTSLADPETPVSFGRLLLAGRRTGMPLAWRQRGLSSSLIVRRPPGAPDVDAFTSLKTLQWLAFETWQATSLGHFVRLVTDDYVTAVHLNAVYPGEVNLQRLPKPRQYWMIAGGTPDQVLETLWFEGVDTERLQATRLLSLPLTVWHDGRAVASSVITEPDTLAAGGGELDVYLSQNPDGGSPGTITVGRRRFEGLVLHLGRPSPGGQAIVSRRLFDKLAFESALQRGLPTPGTALLTIRLDDVFALKQAQARLENTAFLLEPNVELTRTRLARYSLRETGPQGTTSLPVTRTKAQGLVMAQPTFRQIVPRITATVRVGGRETQLESRDGAGDPAWHEHHLLAGGVLADGRQRGGIWLPRRLAEDIFPGLSLVDIVGRSAQLRLHREGKGRVPDIRLPLQVQGVIESTFCLASRADLDQWKAWQNGAISWDPAERTFRTRREVYNHRGTIAAVFYAASEAAVEPLVAQLESAGFDVKHQLEEQRRLGQMAIALATFVLLAVSGTIFNAALNSGGMSWIDVTTKYREIGVKLSWGVTRTNIVLGYALEGLVIGVLACLAGTVLVLAIDAPVRSLAIEAIGLKQDFFIIPIYSMTVAGLAAVAATVVIGFSLAGTVLPICFALQRSPVDLMR